MRIIERSICAAIIVSCLTGPIAAEVTANPPPAPGGTGGALAAVAPKTSFEVTDRYTAQRRPRITVLDFEDTNSVAKSSVYSSSVEAMLVTFFKRKSQFVVVERQKLGSLLKEKQRLQAGMVAVQGGDKESRALLEKIDAFVFGSVTILDNVQIQPPQGQNPPTPPAATSPKEGAGSETAKSRAERIAEIQGPRIEIDAKLISRFDGRIIAAVQRSGPVTCLRSIVERLGVALEQEFLRPYYGKLTVKLENPEYVRVHLTPILPQNALDEEKPPVERSATVTIGSDYDLVQPWTMDPTTYTINSLLSGWYSMRLERPGYEGVEVENARWEVRNSLGQEIVYDRVTDQPLEKADRALSRFVVRVDPLRTEVVDGNALGFSFRRLGGSVASLVKRQYLDDDFSQSPRRVILMGGEKIDLNDVERPAEYADDERCDLFDEQKPILSNHGRTYIGAGHSFDLSSFTGGELIIEDYKGETVPVGVYTMKLWEPAYLVETTEVRVHDKDDKKPVKTTLTRETASLQLEATGPRPANQTTLVGRDTKYRIQLPLDFLEPKELPGMPVDAYTTTTDITGLTGWNRTAAIPATHVIPPVYDTTSESNKPELIEESLRVGPPPEINVKTRFGIAGRLETLARMPDPLAADMFIDRDLETILNLLLYGVPVRPGVEPRSDFWKVASEVGRVMGAGISLNAAGGPRFFAGSAIMSASVRRDQQSPPPAEAAEKPEQQPKPDPFPRDPALLRNLLAQRLSVLDLLVLDPIDMAQLRRFPEVAGIIARFVESGGSLFAFIASPGDYRPLVGAPLAVESMSKPSKRFDLTPGELAGLVEAPTKKKSKVKTRRPLPEISELPAPWRVIAYSKQGRKPRIIERGTQGQGGYVVLWLDNPESFRGRWGGTRSEVEQTRANVEDHVIKKAREVMRSRFDPAVASAPCSAPASFP
jgi:hypothetical protein